MYIGNTYFSCCHSTRNGRNNRNQAIQIGPLS